jgi:hypothetical protein
MAKTVFVLGAGASKEAGAPLMRGFFDTASNVRRGQDHDDQTATAFQLVDQGRRALTAVHSKASFDIRNIESVFGAFQMAKLFHRLPDLTAEEVERLPEAIRRVIVRTLEWSMLFPLDEHQRIGAHGSHLTFVESVQKLALDDRFKSVGVITFNYDLGVDQAFAVRGIPVDYCLAEQPERADGVEIAKLHGSLNWWVCSNTECRGQVQQLSVAAYLQQRKSIDMKDLKRRAVSLAVSDYLPRTHSCGAETMAPYIVPPTWSKAEHHERIDIVWRRAAHMLSEAENIVVMGYSWPSSDEFFHQLFALGSVGDAFLRRFWVFDPNPEIEHRYREMLGPQATDPDVFQFAPLTFSTAANYLPALFNGTLSAATVASKIVGR